MRGVNETVHDSTVVADPDGVTCGIMFSNGAQVVFRKNKRNQTIRIGVILSKHAETGGCECWSDPVPIEDVRSALSSISVNLSSL